MQRLTDRILASETNLFGGLTLDQTPKTLAAALVRLAVTGADGELWVRLRESSDRNDELIAELIALYFYAADRAAAEFFALVSAEAATRDLFLGEAAAEAREQLRALHQDDPDAAGRAAACFDVLLDERRSEYARCRELYRTDQQPLDGTVMFAFYKHVLAHGRETAIFVMSQIQLAEVEQEVAKAFAGVIEHVSVTDSWGFPVFQAVSAN